MKRTIFCGLRLFLAVGLVSGGAPEFLAKARETNAVPGTNTLALGSAIRLAQDNNPQIRVLAADIAAARGEVLTTKTWQNPDVAIAPGFKTTRGPATTGFHGDFGLEQAIEWPGKRALRRAVAEKSAELSELALAGFRNQLAGQVRRAYYAMLGARDVMALREQRLTLANHFVAAARKKVEGGFSPEFEATKAEVEVVAALKALGEAESQRESARVDLNALMGRNPGEPLEVTGSLGADLWVPEAATLLTQAGLRNPAIKIQEAELERTGLKVRSARESRFPDFKIGPQVEYARDEQIVGVGISLPLPFWDHKRGEIATATAAQEKALAELETLRLEVARAVATAWQNLRTAKAGLAGYTPELRQKLKRALDAAEQSYGQGQAPLLLFLETQRTYFDTQSDYLATLQRFYEAMAELEAAVGFPLDQLTPLPTHLK